MGKLMKNLMKLTVAAGAVGGLCYAFKDQIRESKVYQDHNMDDKIQKVKTTLQDKIPKIFDNEDDFDEDDLFTDDFDIEIEDEDRGYIQLSPEDSESATTEEGTDTDSDIPTIEA
ncbi:MAG: hypothetical protein ACI4EK_08540 [Wujia sp.]